MARTVLLALGGNALIRDRFHTTVSDQYATCVETCRHIVTLVKRGYDLVITHGNGPQVGFILRRSELAKNELHQVPLDSCVADTQGAIGYHIQMALANVLRSAGIEKSVASLVTQVVVEVEDPAFQNPSKPIGSFMDGDEAQRHREIDGWQVVEDAGRGYRRVVPSPQPREIVELEAIKALLAQGIIVVAAGGGGIPVIRDDRGWLHGVEAVVDKDLASSLLARQLQASLFIVSTSVEKVFLNFGEANQTAIDRLTVESAEQFIQQGHFAPGSMLPKIRACIDFVQATGRESLITNPPNLSRALARRSGTWIVSGGKISE